MGNSLFYMLVFPASFFSSLVYSEGLFLFLSISSFYYARKRQWAAASALGLLASLTRNFGVIMFIPLLMEYLNVNFGSLIPDLRKIKPDIGYLALVPLGLFGFMAYLQLAFGDALLFIHARSDWAVAFSSVFTPYLVFYRPVFYATIALALAMIAYLLHRRMRLSYIVYSPLSRIRRWSR